MTFLSLFKYCIDYFSLSPKKEEEIDVAKLRIKIPKHYISCYLCGQQFDSEIFNYCSCLNSDDKKEDRRF